MVKVFVDTDVILDLLAERHPFYDHASKLFSLADTASIKIFISSLSIANLNYILSGQYSAAQVRKKILLFKTVVNTLALTDKIIDLALASDFKDFEDGIQYFTATENGLTILITRNVKDYKNSGISVFTPDQFLKERYL